MSLSQEADPANQVALVIKYSPVNAGHVRDLGSIPGSGRSPGGAHGNPLQYSWLENSMDRGDWQATVHGATKSPEPLKTALTAHKQTSKNSGISLALIRPFTLNV